MIVFVVVFKENNFEVDLLLCCCVNNMQINFLSLPHPNRLGALNGGCIQQLNLMNIVLVIIIIIHRTRSTVLFQSVFNSQIESEGNGTEVA